MKQHALPEPITFLSSDYYSAGGELEQIQFLLGHRSVETTTVPDAAFSAQGLEGKEISFPPGRGRSVPLTFPFIEQAIS